MNLRTLVVITIALLSNLSILRGQCDQCEPQLIPNGDFESLISPCNSSGSFFGVSFFLNRCVTGWQENIYIQSLSPDIINPLSGLDDVDNFVTSNMAGLCFGFVPFHNESILSDPLGATILTDPDIAQHLTFQYGVACLPISNGMFVEGPLVDIVNGNSLTVDLYSGPSRTNVFTHPITIDDDIRLGLQTICIRDMPFDQGDELSISTIGQQPDASRACWALIDELNLECEITDHDYSIEATNLGNSNFEFNLVNNGFSTLNFINYNWDFGDGSTLSGTNDPIVTHQYQNDGDYDVVLDLIDDRGCCTQIMITISVPPLCECDIRPILTSSNSCTSIIPNTHWSGSPLLACPNFHTDITTLNQCQCCELELSYVELNIPPCVTQAPIFEINHLWSQLSGEYEIVTAYNTIGNSWRIILTNSTSSNPLFVPCNTHPDNNHPSNLYGNVQCNIGTGSDAFELIVSYCGESFAFNVLVIDC